MVFIADVRQAVTDTRITTSQSHYPTQGYNVVGTLQNTGEKVVKSRV